jgi:hypothetical protein
VVTGDFSLMMKGRTPQSVIEDKVHPLSLDKTLINPPSRLNRAVAQTHFLRFWVSQIELRCLQEQCSSVLWLKGSGACGRWCG